VFFVLVAIDLVEDGSVLVAIDFIEDSAVLVITGIGVLRFGSLFVGIDRIVGLVDVTRTLCRGFDLWLVSVLGLRNFSSGFGTV